MTLGTSAAPVHAPVHTETLTRAKTVTPRELAAMGSEQLPEQSTVTDRIGARGLPAG